VSGHPLYAYLRCPDCKGALAPEGDQLRCGCRQWPVVRSVPRFVASDAYVSSFSFEWNTHSTTQLDSERGDRMSEDTLRAKTGLDPETVRGKLVLDAGTGTGRFAQVLRRWGARVIGADLSLAVEAAQRNVGGTGDALIVQADIARLPFAEATFDFIVSIGVLHHTPDTRRHFEALLPLLKPGGSVCIWVYPAEGAYLLRSHWIPWTSRIPSRMFYQWCRWFVPKVRRNPRAPWARLCACMFPFSQQDYGLENDILDTFDGFSPRYHGVHSPEEVCGWFRAAGLSDVQSLPFATSVRGRKAALPQQAADALYEKKEAVR
jgi:SAM-dependent methyltransferase